MIRFKKTAAQVMDQRYDVDKSILWDYISDFWPQDLNEPVIGILNKTAECAISATSQDNVIESFYPIDSEESTLASSMYFMLDGVNSFEKDDLLKVAKILKNARTRWNVSIPEDFIDFAKSYHSGDVIETDDDVYADDDGQYNITTPNDLEKSASKFSRDVLKHSQSDIIKIAMILKSASQYHDMEIDIPYGDLDIRNIGDEFVSEIEKRAELAEPFFKSAHQADRELYVPYLEKLDEIITMTDHIEHYSDVVKIAYELESIDREFGVDDAWGNEVLSPVEALYLGSTGSDSDDSNEKHIDWSNLSSILEPELADMIAEDPEGNMRYLTQAQRNLVEDYISGQK